MVETLLADRFGSVGEVMFTSRAPGDAPGGEGSVPELPRACVPRTGIIPSQEMHPLGSSVSSAASHREL